LSIECTSEKFFKNQSIIDEDVDKSKVALFYDPPCYLQWY